MSPLNSALLCFFRASCFVEVSIMKVFKSSIDYALRNFVSNLSFFFWWMSPIGTWMSPIGTALLWFFACFLFCSSLNIETIWEFRWTALANVMLRFLSIFNVSTKQCAALLLSRFLFCSSLNLKVFKSSIDYALRNFVSNLSFFFWWKCPVGTALLWVSRSSYFVQVSMLKPFESFGWLHLQM